MLLSGYTICQAQNPGRRDSLPPKQDTLQVQRSPLHSPKKATLRSAILPGWGQAYNKKYWKIPVIYAGAAALIYGIVWNNREFRYYKKAYLADTDTLSYTSSGLNLQPASIAELRNYYRKNRDMCSIGLVGLYVLNIIDANVDAHLFEFNIDDDLSLNIEPAVLAGRNNMYNGFSLTLKF